MEAVTSPRRVGGGRWTSLTVDPSAVIAWLVPFGLVVTLGLRGGGFDTTVWGEIGILVWWLVALAAAAGLRPSGLGWRAWTALGLLAAYAGWTALSLIWTESTESTVGEVARMSSYVAILALLLLVQGRSSARYTLSGLGCAILVVAVVALLSRLQFDWFGTPAYTSLFGTSSRRLSYPLNYWNALAALVATGIPLMLGGATGPRRPLTRAAAAGAVPLLALCLFLTASRGGAIEVIVGVLAFLALAPDRLPKLGITLVTGAGSALLITAANARPEVRDGLRTAAARSEGDQMLLLCAAVVLGVALFVLAVQRLASFRVRPRWSIVPTRRAPWFAGAGVLVALIVFLGAGGPGFVSREWRQFKTSGRSPGAAQVNAIQRLQNVSGNGRYQYWQSAVRAAHTRPWEGRGAGTFQFWWARDRTISAGFVHDAHSLYLQTLAELGIPGASLITAFVLWVVGWGIALCARIKDPERRLLIAAATAAALVFAVAAAFEWIWLIAVLPAVLFALVAAIVATGRGQVTSEVRSRDSEGRRVALTIAGRAAVSLVAVVGLIVVAVPTAATIAVRDSQAQVNAGHLEKALGRAVAAERLQPYAATPQLQEALVRERYGDFRGALAPARRATVDEPTSWETWLVLSRLEARVGNAKAAVRDFRRARLLNPRSPIFAS